MGSHLGVVLMRVLALLPLPWLRALGAGLGYVLYAVVTKRRGIVNTNLALCFPQWAKAKRRQVAVQHFVFFAQAWLDRSWLWHGAAGAVQQRLRCVGDLSELASAQAAVVFAPHFVGLDAGWTALTQRLKRPFTTIYSHQSDQVIDQWVLKGRQRFGQVQLYDRADGPKPVVQGLRNGASLYLLPDMNYGLQESIFVPFFGVQAATVTSLSRLSRLGRAPVIPVVTCLTPQGYEIKVLPAWRDVPTGDLEADTRTMNQRLELFVNTMPAQYYWVHKRFKDRPPGEPEVY